MYINIYVYVKRSYIILSRETNKKKKLAHELKTIYLTINKGCTAIFRFDIVISETIKLIMSDKSACTLARNG